MKLINTTNIELDKRRKHVHLGYDFHMFYPAYLDGGAATQRFEIIDAVRSGKTKHIYNRCLEWCSGHGLLGYNLLIEQQIKHVTFMDYFDLAIKECYFTAEANGRLMDMEGHISSSIAGLPELEKFDLVIGNPPNAKDEQTLVDALATNASELHTEISYLDNTLRITLDQDYMIHREFFTNIGERITDDADIFISVTSDSDEIKDMIAENNFMIVCKYPLPSMGPGAKIWHIKRAGEKL